MTAQVDSKNTTIAAPVDSTRRRFLSQAAGVAAGGAVLALAAVSATADAAAYTATLAPSDDPIFALIEDHKKLRAACGDMCAELDDAEWEAAEEHGSRPIALINWRGYTIGGAEIEDRREQLLSEAEIDPATVEQEYLDAKAREQAKLAAEKAWDVRAGLEVKREDLHRAENAECECAERLSATKPATPAGAAALIQHIIDDDIRAGVKWHMTTVDAAVAALNSMSTAVALGKRTGDAGTP